ncbi:hypothetical protein D9615_002141 [Tricholomella constricta]|uniref:Uncharacterized protein n=1 Tax=Tricholomella constricta TaxID=117010 RepID=A0A8H5MAK0_9AGAR|nr:hypothetical protein D9615_002141 [Tricholomella constricta]
MSIRYGLRDRRGRGPVYLGPTAVRTRGRPTRVFDDISSDRERSVSSGLSDPEDEDVVHTYAASADALVMPTSDGVVAPELQAGEGIRSLPNEAHVMDFGPSDPVSSSPDEDSGASKNLTTLAVPSDTVNESSVMNPTGTGDGSKDSGNEATGKTALTKLTPEQEQAVDTARQAMTPDQRERVDRRTEQIRRVRFPDPEPEKPGEPSRNKGKGIDPRNWGAAELSESEVNPEVQRQILEELNDRRELGLSNQLADVDLEEQRALLDEIASSRSHAEALATEASDSDQDTSESSESPKELAQRERAELRKHLRDSLRLRRELDRLRKMQSKKHSNRKGARVPPLFPKT